MKGKCPFGKIKCSECVLYRQGLRYFADNRKPESFEECAINIATDCLENLVTRSIGNQKATEETRNKLQELTNLFMYLAQRKSLTTKAEPEEIISIDAEVSE